MTGNSPALDTNQAIAILNDRAGAAAWLATLDEVYLPVPVLGELRFGALKSVRAEANMKRVDQLASRFSLLPIHDSTTQRYTAIRAALRSAGTPIPENDVWIAACCVEHGVPLATADGHFDRVDGLRTIDTGF